MSNERRKFERTDGIYIEDRSGGNTRIIGVDQSKLSSEQILLDILKELKIMNLHLSLMTDTTIKKTEVEV